MKNKKLLEEFVALAPKGWKVRVFDAPLEHAGGQSGDIGFMPERADLLIRIHDDRASAEAIVFLWDYLTEMLGTIGVSNGWPEDMGGPYHIGWDYDPMGCNAGCGGKTRIEALVRACVSLWKSKEQK